MTKPELNVRNKELAIEVVSTIDLLKTIDLLPGNQVSDELVRRLIRSSISIGTNYDTTRATKSTRSFISKLKMQVVDNKSTKRKLNVLIAEANQLLSIYTPSMGRIRKDQKS